MMFSIRYKFLAILTGLVCTTIMSFLVLATGLFEADKEAYVFDSGATFAESLAMEVETGIRQASLSIRRIARLAAVPAGDGTSLADSMFAEEPDLIYLGVYGADAASPAGAPPLQTWRNDEFLDMQSAEAGAIESALGAWSVSLPALEADRPQVAGVVLPGGVPLLGVAVRLESGAAGVGLLRQDRLLGVLSRSRMHRAFVLDSFGNVVSHPDRQKVGLGGAIADSDWQKKVMAHPLRSGALELTMPDGAVWLTGYSKLALGGVTVVAQMPKEQAFAAARQLVVRSALFALALVSLAFMVSMVFSRSLTRPIMRLFEATKRIATGDFSVRVEKTTGDEIGVLTTSFNGMAGRIVELMASVRDKARMEKELETAKLVQENLFPPNRQSCDAYDLSGYYTPASECGGDWWGYFADGDSLYVLLGDATGHGVPAALITAAAQSCCTTIHQIRQRAPELKLSPATIMTDLNAAVYHAGKGKMNMTFFVSRLDLGTGELTYCNASHELPVVLRRDGDQVEPDMLIGDPDPCLGEAVDSEYHEHTYQLQAQDTLVWYTDGLVELRDQAEKEWGERRFLKVLKQASDGGVEELQGRIMEAARAHQGSVPADDDITCIVVRLNQLRMGALAAS